MTCCCRQIRKTIEAGKESPGSFMSTLWSVMLYCREGVVAQPTVLEHSFHIRDVRCAQRAFAFDAWVAALDTVAPAPGSNYSSLRCTRELLLPVPVSLWTPSVAILARRMETGGVEDDTGALRQPKHYHSGISSSYWPLRCRLQTRFFELVDRAVAIMRLPGVDLWTYQSAAACLVIHWQPSDKAAIVAHRLLDVALEAGQVFTEARPSLSNTAPTLAPDAVSKWTLWPYQLVRIKLLKGQLTPAELISHIKVRGAFDCLVAVVCF